MTNLAPKTGERDDPRACAMHVYSACRCWLRHLNEAGRVGSCPAAEAGGSDHFCEGNRRGMHAATAHLLCASSRMSPPYLSVVTCGIVS